MWLFLWPVRVGELHVLVLNLLWEKEVWIDKDSEGWKEEIGGGAAGEGTLL